MTLIKRLPQSIGQIDATITALTSQLLELTSRKMELEESRTKLIRVK